MCLRPKLDSLNLFINGILLIAFLDDDDDDDDDDNNNNNNNNTCTYGGVYSAIIITKSLQEFNQFSSFNDCTA